MIANYVILDYRDTRGIGIVKSDVLVCTCSYTELKIVDLSTKEDFWVKYDELDISYEYILNLVKEKVGNKKVFYLLDNLLDGDLIIGVSNRNNKVLLKVNVYDSTLLYEYDTTKYLDAKELDRLCSIYKDIKVSVIRGV